MTLTGTSQSALARYSGVRQPTISQVLTGKVGLSDGQLERLLSCMGHRLEVVRRPVVPELTRSELRSWRLHRELATRLHSGTLAEWLPKVRRNVSRLRAGVQGEPHRSNLALWEQLVERGDAPALHRVLTGLDRHSIEMRETAPFQGLLPESVRLGVMEMTS